MPKELTYLEAIARPSSGDPRSEGVRPRDDGAPYGGAFGVTAGLVDEFGEARCLDTPISESAIIGVSIGASQRGYRPVAEMQFADFITCGFDQIVNQAATLRYRTGGRATCPIVVRAPSGGNVGGGLYHSQNPEGWFIHRPGLKVVAPSNAWDAKGLLKEASATTTRSCTWSTNISIACERAGPEGEELVPIGVAAIRGRKRCPIATTRDGGASLEAPIGLRRKGSRWSIDLRSLMP